MPTAPYQSVSVASASYPTIPQVSLAFVPDQYTFYDRSTVATEDVYISFDGVVDHGILRALLPLSALNWECKHQKVWFRQAIAGAAILVDVMAGSRE